MAESAPPAERSPASLPGGSVLGAARQQAILDLMGRGEIIAVAALAARFGVSQETIRRDIRVLEEAGHVRRVHGGAVPTAGRPSTVDLSARRPVSERLAVDRRAKTAAAQAALALFLPDMAVFLGGSSTMLVLAELLAARAMTLDVTTNMVDIATVLGAAGHSKVTLLGGLLNPATRTVCGPETLAALDRRVFDLAVMGVSAIDAIHGFLGPAEWHAAMGAALAARARRIAFVAAATKFGRSDAHVVHPLAGVSALATDRAPPADLAARLVTAGVALLLPGEPT
jgi:DeoR/GlpR family transcriptional regulator of sugar metabolism